MTALAAPETRQQVMSASYPPAAHTSPFGSAVTQTVAILENASHRSSPSVP